MGYRRSVDRSAELSTNGATMIAMGLVAWVFAVLAAGCGSVLLVLVYLDHRASRIDDSIASFRRHIDALSPEARHESMSHGNSTQGDGRYF